ncbi:hypothetical protein EKK58_00880 [Candidatus Dependentiae bacterium]|nr:MAG: hypothetical protein EKK58_00880 [Candidatus Dependentiae bacterium]
MLKLVITRRNGDIHCALEGNPAVWDCGKTTAEAVGKWIVTHGADHGVQLVVPGTEGASPDLPDGSQGVLTEDDLFAFANERTGRPMTIHEREWCLQEIASVEGYNRADYELSDNKGLARGVLSAWVDFCRDKGLM